MHSTIGTTASIAAAPNSGLADASRASTGEIVFAKIVMYKAIADNVVFIMTPVCFST
jgi:hypothetical protein